MNSSDTLILGVNINNYIVGSDGIITEVYSHPTAKKYERALRKICLWFGEAVSSRWLGKWYQESNDYKTIILFDTGNQKFLLRLLKKRWPHARIILWYWNPMERTASLDGINRNDVEVWSYHEEDCRKYNLKYNTQFFFKNKIGKKVPEFDFYFLGADKGARVSILEQMNKEFARRNLKFKCILVRKKESCESSIEYSRPISPAENFINIANTRCVVDIVEPSEFTGFTLRPFEALSVKKKLLTNNPKVKEADFYSPQNIFVWGYDDLERISSFLETPFDDKKNEEVSYYQYEKWIVRFDESGGSF